MKIATGTKDDTTGKITFPVSIPFLAPATLVLEKLEKPKDTYPDYGVFCEGERCGALWKRVPRNGGDAFLSGPIESPVFPGGRLEVAVFVSREEGRHGQMDMTWRPDDRSQAPAQSGSPQGGGAAAADGDDDIPF